MISSLKRLVIRAVRRGPLDVALRERPWPLLDGENRMVVSQSPRAASAHVVIWHFDKVDLLKEADAYHRWPHRYRMNVYFWTDIYRDALARLREEGTEHWNLIKIMRDPATRCVSSYRHALYLGYADEEMQRVLGRRIDHREGFSYRTFLDYLAQIDLTRCNPHHRLQKHSIDLLEYRRVYLIDVDSQELGDALGEIERIHGLETSSRATAAVGRFSNRNAPRAGDPKQDAEVWRTPLAQSDTTSDAWPKAQLEGSVEAARKAREIYRQDCELLASLAERSELHG